MTSSIFDGLQLVNASGWVILACITLTLVLGVGATLVVGRRYAAIEREVRLRGGSGEAFTHPLLARVVRDARAALQRGGGDINTQAIIEHGLYEELGGSMLAERFVKAANGLVIILGLAGAFYGNTLAIGRLVGLVSDEGAVTTDVAQTLTRGLTHALAGMSVAFATSLFGIVAAVVLTLVGVLSNLADRRQRIVVQLESYLDNVLLRGAAPGAGASDAVGLARTVEAFDRSVGRLESAVAAFDGALRSFATTTGDFHQFNLHLKDNVQRMSLSFGDMSEVVKAQVALLAERGPRR